MQVGPMALLDENDTDDPENEIDNCWEYAGAVLNLPFPGAEGYIP